MSKLMKEDGLVHYSIDDVWKSLLWLTEHRPSSLFEMRFFGTLKYFHETFDAKFTLYCIAEGPGYSFCRIPPDYREEFLENSAWLRFGFHSVTDQPFKETESYQESFFAFVKKQEELGMGKTDTLRLHSWGIRDDQLDFLRSQGISTILYPDEAHLPYDENGLFMRKGMVFRRTGVWLEKKEYIDGDMLKTGGGVCTVFTHEWCFDREKDKMEKALFLHNASGYCFL